MKILIMAGGSGERFWPLSTKENPKQLLSLVSDKSMIRETVDRVLRIVSIDDVFVATNAIQVSGIKRELPDIPENNIIIEPAFRDTAAAIAYGSTIVARYLDDPTIVVLAADHLIKDEVKFGEVLLQASCLAEKGDIITLGIKATKPEIGYGYIKLDHINMYKPTKVIQFMEKPNYEVATKYLNNGKYVWNSGMFIFKYSTIMGELKKYIPNHSTIIESMIETIGDLNGLELSNAVKNYFAKFDRISIDFAVMEKSDKIYCVPVDIGWNDIGSFNSLVDVFESDEFGNVVKDCRYIYVDSNNNIVISEEKEKTITTIGVNNTMIVNTKNNLLISKTGMSERTKELLRKL